MSLRYQGNNLYIVNFGHQQTQLSGDEIQSLVDEVGKHIETEFESPFYFPTIVDAERVEEVKEYIDSLTDAIKALTTLKSDLTSDLK